MVTRVLILALRGYKKFVSPILARKLSCRFYPTCADYATLAIKKYGARRGVLLTAKRLRRCRPDNLDSCIDFP